MHTAGTVTQDKPNTDLQIFVPPTIGAMVATGSPPVTFTPAATYTGTSPAGGTSNSQMPSLVIPASATTNITFNLSSLLFRQGILQSNNFATNTSQEAFGTANGPGPSSVPGTSGPSGLGYREVNEVNSDTVESVGSFFGSDVVAPVPSALLATLVGPQRSGSTTQGDIVTTVQAGGKGIRVKYIDAIYRVNGVALTTLAINYFQYTFALAHDASIGWNGGISEVTLPSAALTINSAINKAHRERAVLLDLFGNPLPFVTTDGSAVAVTLQFQTPSGSTADLLGIILGCDFNFN